MSEINIINTKNITLIGKSNSGITEGTLSFDLTIGSTSTPVKSWGGETVYEDLYFKITNLQSDKVWGTRIISLQVKESYGRMEFLELLSGENTLKSESWIQIDRKVEDYGEVALQFNYKWVSKVHISDVISVGNFSYQKNSEYQLYEQLIDYYNSNNCYYTKDSETLPVYFCDDGIELKYTLSLTEKEKWSPQQSFFKQITLENQETKEKKEIQYELKDYISGINQIYFNTKIEIDSFDEVYQKDESNNLIIEPLIITLSTITILFIPFSRKPIVDWSTSYTGTITDITINFINPKEYVYNCSGNFTFKNNENLINAIEYFFEGLGFYYNFEKGIAKNTYYYNEPYQFYLYDYFSKSKIRDQFINAFYFRDPLEEEEKIESNYLKKKQHPYFSAKEPIIKLFYEFSNRSGLTITLQGSLETDKNYIPSFHYFCDKEEDGGISLYTTQNLLYQFKSEENYISLSYEYKKNQELNPQIIYRNLGTENMIDNTKILINYNKIKTYDANEVFDKKWNNYIIIDSQKFSIELIERDSITNNLLKSTPLQLQNFENSENYSNMYEAFLSSSSFIFPSTFLPSFERTYSFKFKIHLENFKESKEFSNECCYWIPFAYNFSTLPVVKKYEPFWEKRIYNSTHYYFKGLYRKENGNIVTQVGSLSLSEEDTYYECIEISTKEKSAFYEESRDTEGNLVRKFYGNLVKIPFLCSIKVNSFFYTKDNDNIRYNKFLEYLKEKIETHTNNLISFPELYGLIEYTQEKQSEWKKKNYNFSPNGEGGSLYKTEYLNYTFPSLVDTIDSIPSELILSTTLDCPLLFQIQDISSSLPLYFRANLGKGINVYWEYPAMGKLPTVAYRKNRLGINSLKINDRPDHILIMEQIDETNSRYISVYNHQGTLTLQLDLQTGDYYFGGQLKDTPLIET